MGESGDDTDDGLKYEESVDMLPASQRMAFGMEVNTQRMQVCFKHWK